MRATTLALVTLSLAALGVEDLDMLPEAVAPIKTLTQAREDFQRRYILEVLEPRASRLLFGEESGGAGQVRRREELHRHGRELCGLRPGMTLPDER